MWLNHSKWIDKVIHLSVAAVLCNLMSARDWMENNM